MRKKLVAGNWKMNKTYQDSKKLIKSIGNNLDEDTLSKIDVVICPPFTSLSRARKLTNKSKINIGAQNMYYENDGAYTGEISASMLKALGCKYVILGHSERRQYFSETDFTINLKLKKAIENELISIVCVGESLEQRENKIQNQIVKEQLTNCLTAIDRKDFNKIVIAYEPVWAIGTGKTATPEQANQMHIFIRETIEKLYNQDVSANIKILYGGSVNENNSQELFNQSDIDGGLIGGASLKPESFVKIILSAIN
ncbi:MAG: triose-phosphate isomerase [Ignavibacteria bacterium]|nr:triose-phosphate isomerase [Ignavibacteria bacterium]